MEFMRSMSQRDPKALEGIYDRYARVVFSLFVRITRDQSVAEDLVQELFLRIWNRSREFDASKGSVAVWILSITRNMAIDYVRSAQAQFSVRVQPIDGMKYRALDQLADCELNLHNRRQVAKALVELTSHQRLVIELAYYEGFSQSEIARRLNVPLGTVKLDESRNYLSTLRVSVWERKAAPTGF